VIAGGGDSGMATEDKRKHLDLLQAAITRMAANSYLLKGWCVTLATALFGFSAKEGAPRLALVALLPILAFWGLDAYYLGLERKFRELYRVATTAEALAPAAETNFNMTPEALGFGDWLAAARSPAVLWLHLPLALAALGVYAALHGCVWKMAR
jgi:hypothetical protein